MRKRKRWKIGLLLILGILLLTGCEKEQIESKEEAKPNQEEAAKKISSLCFIIGMDTQGKSIVLKNSTTLEEIPYEYTGATYVKDKYGKSISMSQLPLGEAVTVTIQKNQIKEIQVSKEIDTYADVKHFQLNIEDKSLTVGKSQYYFDDNLLVFYKNNRISVAEISNRDTICLKGSGKKVYAIQVTEGHGTVVLENTQSLEGGYVTIGNVLSLQITQGMRIEVPEGKYLLSVANDGYGGSTEITVDANRETILNLEELKGEGPKTGMVQFQVTPENAAVSLSGNPIEVTNPQELKYGSYRIGVTAEGYADFNGVLVVNSQESTINLSLTTEEEAAKTAAEKAAAEKAAAEKAAAEKAEAEKAAAEKT
ncbi:MAG: hypothetical protein RSF88_04545, partial [Lachnospiraceae bacterium]